MEWSLRPAERGIIEEVTVRPTVDVEQQRPDDADRAATWVAAVRTHLGPTVIARVIRTPRPVRAWCCGYEDGVAVAVVTP